MTLLWVHRQRHRGCLGLDAVEAGLPLCGVSYGYGDTATQIEAVIPVTRESLKDESIELEPRLRSHCAPFLGPSLLMPWPCYMLLARGALRRQQSNKKVLHYFGAGGIAIIGKDTIGCNNLAGRGAYTMSSAFRAR